MRFEYFIRFIMLMSAAVVWAESPPPSVPDVTAKEPPAKQVPIHETTTSEGAEETWGLESTSRSETIYPSNYGTAGIFRIRSAESLPDGALTFGIGGEFYAMTDNNIALITATGYPSAHTIAESLFVGYAPTRNLTLAVMRRNSSTTFGNPQQLISSLGDLNFTGMYSFPINDSFAFAPLADILIASDFNNLNPSGQTVSAGLGGAATYSLWPATGVPLFLHGNLIYHNPEIRSLGPPVPAPESFFNFSRYHTLTLGLGAEYKIGDFIPFLELNEAVEMNSGLGFGNDPSRASFGARFTPLANKSLAVLLGADIGLGRGLVVGVPYSPAYQVIGQLSYTVGVTQTERKHYFTTKDVNVVDRKFVIKKNINFKIGSADLDPASTHLLDQIADVVKRNKVKKLLIGGHTDSTHNDDYNLKLSQDRANSVKRYLVAQGIPEETFLVQGYGKRKPRASNLTEEGRALNRRVEFFILE